MADAPDMTELLSLLEGCMALDKDGGNAGKDRLLTLLSGGDPDKEQDVINLVKKGLESRGHDISGASESSMPAPMSAPMPRGGRMPLLTEINVTFDAVLNAKMDGNMEVVLNDLTKLGSQLEALMDNGGGPERMRQVIHELCVISHLPRLMELVKLYSDAYLPMMMENHVELDADAELMIGMRCSALLQLFDYFANVEYFTRTFLKMDNCHMIALMNLCKVAVFVAEMLASAGVVPVGLPTALSSIGLFMRQIVLGSTESALFIIGDALLPIFSMMFDDHVHCPRLTHKVQLSDTAMTSVAMIVKRLLIASESGDPARQEIAAPLLQAWDNEDFFGKSMALLLKDNAYKLYTYSETIRMFQYVDDLINTASWDKLRTSTTVERAIAMLRDLAPRTEGAVLESIEDLLILLETCDTNSVAPRLRTSPADRLELWNILVDYVKAAGKERRECANCAAVTALPRVKLKFCSKCKSVLYCSRECQVNHWSEHREYCAMKRGIEVGPAGSSSDSVAPTLGVQTQKSKKKGGKKGKKGKKGRK